MKKGKVEMVSSVLFSQGEETAPGFNDAAVLLGELLTRMQSSYRRC
jgi:hypothetical protein